MHSDVKIYSQGLPTPLVAHMLTADLNAALWSVNELAIVVIVVFGYLLVKR